jgi:hypothetical protein
VAPVIEHYNMIMTAYWVAVLAASVLVLHRVTNFFTDEGPGTLLRGVVTVLAVAAAMYFAYDISGYVLARQLAPTELALPPQYTLSLWLLEPLEAKWYYLSFAPFIRYCTVIVALVAGALVEKLILDLPITLTLLIFPVQIFLTLGAMLLVSFAFSLGLRYYESHVAAWPKRADTIQQIEQAEPPPDETGAVLRRAHTVRHAKGGTSSPWQRLGSNWDSFNAHLAPLYALLQPVTRHLPLPVEDFLNSGGWIITLGLIGATIIFWPRIKKRRRKIVQYHQTLKLRRVPAKYELGFIGDAFTGLGPKQLTVNGVPARLRLVVLGRTLATAGRLSEDEVPRMLNGILHGMAEVMKYDSPRAVVWHDARTHDGFRQKLLERVVFPQAKGEPTPWVLLIGEMPGRESPLLVGLALHRAEESAERVVSVPAGQWRHVLGFRDVSMKEQQGLGRG